MIMIVCSKCGKDISNIRYPILLRGIKKLGITDKWRVRTISNQIRDGRPPKDEEPATEEEIYHVKQLGHDLVALMLYEMTFCDECARTEARAWSPLSGEPCPFKLSPEEQRATFYLVKGGKEEDGQK